MQNENPHSIRFVFFGTSRFSVGVLDALKEHGFVPSLIVATPDEPQGRGLKLTPVPAKLWAGIHGIPVFQPAKLREESVAERLAMEHADIFIVASYGKIIPKTIFDMPMYKTLNVHPSLLPKLRGASPIQTAILTENETGVTIMQISEAMDEGPIVAQETVSIPEWPPRADLLENLLAKHGGDLVARILPGWVTGDITAHEQDHSQATYTKKIEKADADITHDSAELALRKVRAYAAWPRARKGDLIITEAHIENDELVPDRVIPPGKREMDYADYIRGKRV